MLTPSTFSSILRDGRAVGNHVKVLSWTKISIRHLQTPSLQKILLENGPWLSNGKLSEAGNKKIRVEISIPPFPTTHTFIDSWLACNWCFLASSSSCFFNAPARSRSRLGQIPFSVESRHSLFSISLLFPLFKIFENVNGCFLHHSRKHRNRMVVPECP